MAVSGAEMAAARREGPWPQHVSGLQGSQQQAGSTAATLGAGMSSSPDRGVHTGAGFIIMSEARATGFLNFPECAPLSQWKDIKIHT